ncbi:unnamed protein product [Linum tenue]|uniref:Uncharacterized protein n=1 Tax=Linum tenue TaxID=586396 RepID=A0AAV0QM87_9ROSI|nr:unnamed protein product [Linum tenue]
MLSRLLPKPSQLRRLTNLYPKPQSSSPLPTCPPTSRFTTFFRPLSTGGNNDNDGTGKGGSSASDLWKLSSDTSSGFSDPFFTEVAGGDGGDLQGISDAPGPKAAVEKWAIEDGGGVSAGGDVFGQIESDAGSAAGTNNWGPSKDFMPWDLKNAAGEEKSEIFDPGSVFGAESRTGPNRAFGDLIAESGITDEMLDSLIALKDFEGVEGLPTLGEIEDIRYEKSRRKSTRAEMERQKQEEIAKARVRLVDDKGRAYGTGRRKCSIARVWIQPGEGNFSVNEKQFDVYFPMLDHRAALLRPFSETKTLGRWDIDCTVKGGGVSGQVGAIQLGISRALQNWEPDLRPPLRNGRSGGFRGGRGGDSGGRGRGGGGRGGGRFGDRGGSGMKPRGGGRGGFGGRGGGRGRGRGGGGMKGGSKVVVEPHRHEGVFIAKGKEDALVTKNLVPGEAVYNEKRVSVQNEDGTKVEYRVWNPFRSKLAAAILGGVDNIWIKPGAKVLYLGAASGTTVSHVSDLVGPTGVVYAVEFSHRSGRDLVNMAKKRTNVIPIIEDARHPAKYRMLVGMVDVIFSDVAQPDQARILALNASYFLKAGGHFVISIKANCIDSTVPAEAVFESEVKKMTQEQFKPAEQVTLEPFERDHACVIGAYRVPKKQKA